MQFYLWHVALVHVVELKVALVNSEVADLEWELSREVCNLLHNYSLHREIDRLVRTVAVDGCFLEEVSQLTCVVGEPYREFSSTSNLVFWIIRLEAAAANPHIVYPHVFRTLVFYLESGCGRFEIFHLATVYLALLHHKFLCLCR